MIRIKNRLPLSLFLIFLSCSSPSQKWCSEETCGSCASEYSKKIILKPENRFRGIEIEITRTHSGERMYLNAFSLSFPSEPEDCRKTAVSVRVMGKTKDFLAFRFEGGQRLLVPKETANWITENLLESRSLTISVGRYKSEIIPSGFSKVYDRKLDIEPAR